jgi:hypothetical protein
MCPTSTSRRAGPASSDLTNERIRQRREIILLSFYCLSEMDTHFHPSRTCCALPWLDRLMGA